MKHLQLKFPLGVNHWFVPFMWGLFFFTLPMARDANLGVVFGMLTVSPLFVSRRDVIQQFQQHSFLLLLGGLFILQLLGLFYSDNLKFGWKFIDRQYILLLIPLLCIIYSKSIKENGLRYLFYWLLFVALAAWLTLCLYWMPVSWSEPICDWLHMPAVNHNSTLEFGMGVTFMNKIQFSNLISVTVLMGSFLWLRGYKKWSTAILLLFLFVFSFLLGGRGGTLSMLIGLGVLIYGSMYQFWYPGLNAKFGAFKTWLIISIVPLAVMGTLIFGILQISVIQKRYEKILDEIYISQSGEVFEQPEHITKHQTTISRIIAYEYFWKAITNNNIWFGVGTGDVNTVISPYYDNDELEVPNHFHTLYLTVWLEIGLVGLLLFILSWFYVVGRLWVIGRFGRWVVVALVVYFVVSFIPDSMLRKQVAGTLFPLSFCFYYLLNHSAHKTQG